MRADDQPALPPRRPWAPPTLKRLRSGDAEIAPRVVNDDGPYTNTS